MTTFIIFLLAVMSLLGWTLAAVHAREKDDAVMALESQQDQPCEVPNDLQGDVNGRRLLNLDYRIEEIRHHVDHLATVQALILKDLKKEHHIEPAKDVLVTISDLPELKKSKERSA